MRVKNKKFILCMAAIIFAIYNIAIFGIFGFNNHTASFWVSYAFVLIMFMAVIAAVWLLECNNSKTKEWLFRLPLIKYSIIFTLIEITVSTLIMSFSDKVAVGVAIFVEAIVLGVYSVLIILCLISKETIADLNTNIENHALFMKQLMLDAEMVASYSENKSVKEAYTSLAESIRFSDPSNGEKLGNVETQLQMCIKMALEDAKNKNFDECMRLYSQAVVLLEQRNKICKMTKT